jgi:hypothetical protein
LPLDDLAALNYNRDEAAILLRAGVDWPPPFDMEANALTSEEEAEPYKPLYLLSAKADQIAGAWCAPFAASTVLASRFLAPPLSSACTIVLEPWPVAKALIAEFSVDLVLSRQS